MNSLPHTILVLGLLLPAAAQAQGAIEAWVQRYDGRENSKDSSLRGMAVDTNGNVYVTGTSLCHNPEGPGEWATIRYSSSGVPVWTNYFGEPGYEAHAIAGDAKGDVLVTGMGLNLTTVKYSGGGVPLWTNRYNPDSTIRDPWAVAVDPNGNVFVAARPYIAGGYEYLTLKYSSAGVLLWAGTYSRSGQSDSAEALAVDTDGNAVVTGSSVSSDGKNIDYLTVKYSSTGTLMWARRYNGPGGDGGPGTGVDHAWALAVDGEANVIVTGKSQNVGTYDMSYATIKYSSTGEPIWTNRYNGPSNYSPDTAVAVDASGNVFVTGSAASTGGWSSEDYVTLKYSSAGVPLWTNRYHPGHYLLSPRGLAVDRCGNVFATGYGLDMDAQFNDIHTVAYSSSGAQLWSMRYNGPASRRDWGFAVKVDANGSVYVAGSSEAIGSGDGLAQDYDYVTIKYVTPPIITRQPQSRTNAAGTTASFSVEAMGGTPLSYQWRRDGTNLVDGGNIAGVTTTNLLIANVQLEDACDYTVVVTNEWGSATSVAAHLTVTIPPSAGRFTNFKYSAETGFCCIFRDATIGQSYRIQRSTSAVEGSWMDWMNFTYTEPMALTDVGATGMERRFYRAMTP